MPPDSPDNDDRTEPSAAADSSSKPAASEKISHPRDDISSDGSYSQKRIKLTYFNVEGSAEQVRLALALAKVDYTDDRMKYDDWQEVKKTAPYGKVPFMTIDGNTANRRAQSGAMMRYVAHTYAKDTLYPTESLFDIEEVIGLVDDTRESLQPAIYIAMYPEKYGRSRGFVHTPEGQELIQKLRETWVKEELQPFLGFLDGWLAKNNGEWMATRNQPSLADCVVIPFLRSLTKANMDHIPDTVLDAHPKIVDYIKRFCALPQIKGRYTDGTF